MRRQVRKLGIGNGACATQGFVWERTKQGTLICDYGQGGVPATMEWSRHDSLVLVRATAEPDISPTTLYDWWSHQGIGSPMNNRLSYPDSREHFVLERSGMTKDQCHRTSQYNESEAALMCEVGLPESLVLAYYGTLGSLRSSFYVRHPTNGTCLTRRIPRIDGWRTIEEPGFRAYSVKGEGVGKRACYVSDEVHGSIVEWTNENSRIYGWAQIKGTGETLEPLFRWWLHTGRFLTD